MTGASGARFHFLVAAGACIAPACAFIYDFPDQVVETASSAASGGGNAGGGDQGGGGSSGGGACDLVWPVPEAVAFAPESDTEGTYIGGVVRHEGQVFVHGNFGGNLLGYPGKLPPNATLISYMARLDDGASKAEILGSVTTCEATQGFLATYRAIMVGDVPVGVGSIPSQSTAGSPTEVHFDNAGTGVACGQGNGFLLEDDDVAMNAHSPYIAGFRGVEAPDVRFDTNVHAVMLDAAWSGDDVVAMGIGYGQAWGASFGDEQLYRYHLVRFSGDQGLDQGDAVPIDVWADASLFSQGGVEANASVTVDDTNTAWATGGECMGGDDGCETSSSFFLTRWGPADQAATQAIPGSDMNRASFGSAIEYASNKLVIAGGYSGTLSGTPLPAATADIDPFVVAVSRDDPKNTVWAWPTTSSTLDRSLYEAVVDIAVVAAPDCGTEGSVYVAGCIVGPGATTRSCLRPYLDSDKRAFLVKLDLSSGAEISADVYEPQDTMTGLFLPTAIDADAFGLWVAFNLQGNADIPGLGVIAGGQGRVEGKLIRFSP